jgi:peroxiredoxin
MFTLFLLATFAPAFSHSAMKAFHLQDTVGAWHDATEWNGAKAVVLFFVSIDCPISNSYVPEMQRLNASYEKRGVRMYAVQPDAGRAPDDVKKYAADFGFTFPVLHDPQQSLTRATGATIQPQVVLLSPRGDVLYSGRIDDRYIEIGKSRYQASTHDLRDAMDAVLAGKPVVRAKTQAVGCVIPMQP